MTQMWRRRRQVLNDRGAAGTAVTVPRNISSGAVLQVGTGSLGVKTRIPRRWRGRDVTQPLFIRMKVSLSVAVKAAATKAKTFGI